MPTPESVVEIKERGYTVLEGALDADTLARFRAELQPFLDEGPFGRNDFEGHRSKRVYAMLAKTPTVTALVEHPDVLAIVDEFLMPNYLLTSCLAIDLHPGETRQSFHFDGRATGISSRVICALNSPFYNWSVSGCAPVCHPCGCRYGCLLH